MVGKHTHAPDISDVDLFPFPRQAILHYIDWCRQSFAINGLVDFYLADNGSPMVHMAHPNGSTANVHLLGANVTSFTAPDGSDLLHLRQQQMQPGEPVE